MRRAFATAGLCLAWLCAQGALLESVQVLVWGSMFAQNVRTMSVAAALSRTFDPQRACEMCQAVREVRQEAPASDRAPGQVQDSAKLVLVYQTAEEPLTVSALPLSHASTVQRAMNWVPSVPTPPPRGGQV